MDSVRALKNITAKYGLPVIIEKKFQIEKPFSPITKKDRWGEVIFVLRRPGGKFLVTTKDWYPQGVHRFPGGGINHGEDIESALYRELKEEFGLMLTVERFLSVVYYRFSDATGWEGEFVSFVFLFPELAQELTFLDDDEGTVSLADLDISQLESEITKLHSVTGEMKDWALFRSAVTEAVTSILKKVKGF